MDWLLLPFCPNEGTIDSPIVMKLLRVGNQNINNSCLKEISQAWNVSW